MDNRLIEAAEEGDVGKLHNLIKGNGFLLRFAALSGGNNPLHIACVGGHVDFVHEILIQNPGFAQELNQDGLSPLHIASASGNIEIVKELLKVGSYLCSVKGAEKKIPLHYAVVKGRVNVIRELVSVCLGSVEEVTARGENCFHLAVKNNQFEAFKVLCGHVVSSNKEYVLNMKDERGNSILHLAASRKQYEVVDLLLDEDFGFKAKLEMNCLNKTGLTPLDVLISQRGGDSDIEEMLRLSGALRNQEMHSLPQPLQNSTAVDQFQIDNQSGQEQSRRRSKSASSKLQDYFKYDKINESPSKARNTLLVIAILIVTATYQAVLSPPGGVWQDDLFPKANNKTSGIGSSSKKPRAHTAGEAVMGTNNPISYGFFLISNSVGFFMSLHMMNFLTCGLPLQFELRVALIALVWTYDACMVAITPSGNVSLLFTVLSILMPISMPLLTIVVRDFKKGRPRQRELESVRETA